MPPRLITLIGMPSSGKSTIGHALAAKLGYRIMDLDAMVEEKEGQSLISILEAKGGPYFLDMQWAFLQQIQPDEKAVISPAGSIIYQTSAMEWLKAHSKIVFLDTPFETIEARLAQKPKAIVGLKEKGLKKLWEERIPVYKKFADTEVRTEGKNVESIVGEIMVRVSSR